MIKSINGGGYIAVTGSYPTYINSYNTGAAGIGNMRYDPRTQNVEVFDGSNWQTLSNNHVMVELAPTAKAAIDWAIKKMAEETELQQLVKDNPAVKIAYDQVMKSTEQLKTTIILSKDEQTTS